MTDEEMLIEMDDFGDDHTTIHEAARRIREKNDRIAALEAEAKTREVSEAEIAAYTLQAFGDRHHAINRHSEDLNTCSYPTCVNLTESIVALLRTATTPDKKSKAVDDESIFGKIRQWTQDPNNSSLWREHAQ